MYGPVAAIWRSMPVRNSPLRSSVTVMPASLAAPRVGSSLNLLAPLKALDSGADRSSNRPLSTSGRLTPSCGTPVLWNLLSENVGPEWRSEEHTSELQSPYVIS